LVVAKSERKAVKRGGKMAETASRRAPEKR